MSGLYLYLSGNWGFGDSATWELQSKLLPVPQPNNCALFLHLHLSQTLTLASAFYFKRQGYQGLCTVSLGLPDIFFLLSLESSPQESLFLPEFFSKYTFTPDRLFID